LAAAINAVSQLTVLGRLAWRGRRRRRKSTPPAGECDSHSEGKADAAAADGVLPLRLLATTNVARLIINVLAQTAHTGTDKSR
jgi:hypothetical protein